MNALSGVQGRRHRTDRHMDRQTDWYNNIALCMLCVLTRDNKNYCNDNWRVVSGLLKWLLKPRFLGFFTKKKL